MRVTAGPPRDVVTVVAAAALALNVVLLVTTVGGAASPDDATDTFTPPASATTTLDAELVNPWAAGDAAVLRALAEVGGAGPSGCPGLTSESDPPS